MHDADITGAWSSGSQDVMATDSEPRALCWAPDLVAVFISVNTVNISTVEQALYSHRNVISIITGRVSTTHRPQRSIDP